MKIGEYVINSVKRSRLYNIRATVLNFEDHVTGDGFDFHKACSRHVEDRIFRFDFRTLEMSV